MDSTEMDKRLGTCTRVEQGPHGIKVSKEEEMCMKMIRAIVRPEKSEIIAEKLAEVGIVSMTKMHVFGRGKTKGLQVGDIRYDEFPKVMLLMVVQDDVVGKAVEVVIESGKTGNIGDGKIFVSAVDAAYTVRTGEAGL
jgi:nitrogen regulatory protein PII 1